MNHIKSFSLVTPRTGRWLAVAAVVTSMAVLGGCANRSASSGVYSYDQAQREQIVRTGTVTGVRPIVIQNDKSSGVGMVAGQGIEAPKFHMFYGFVAIIAVGIIYSYRQQMEKHRYLLYGLGSLFIMGLGIRAMLVGLV